MPDRNLILKVAREIHITRLKSCYFPNHDGYCGFDAAYARQPWPENRKDAERLLQDGQCYMEVAIDQAKAVLKLIENDNK